MKSALCACGCGKFTNIAKGTNACNGHVRGVPYKYLLGHQAKTRTPDLDRYRVIESGCWIWPKTNPAGNRAAPIFWRGQRTAPYRALWQETFRLRIPSDLQLDHLCRDGRCVNPDHLEVVTAKENARRRTRSADRAIVEQVRNARGPTMEVARRYGVRHTLVSQIRSGVRWQRDDDIHRAEYLNAIAELVRAHDEVCTKRWAGGISA